MPKVACTSATPRSARFPIVSLAVQRQSFAAWRWPVDPFFTLPYILLVLQMDPKYLRNMRFAKKNNNKNVEASA